MKSELMLKRLLEPEHPLVPELRKALGCPIDWDTVPQIYNRPALANDLRIYWAKMIEEFEVDREMRWYSRNEVEFGGLDEAALRTIQINAATWRAHAEKEYLRRVGFLRKLYYAGWDKYTKHRPPVGKSREQILQLTKPLDAPSLFFSDSIIPRCEELLWEAVADDLIAIVEERPAHLFTQNLRELGACGGRPSDVMRIDLDYSNGEAHGHPRPAPPGRKLLGVSYGEQIFSDEDLSDFSYNIDGPPVNDFAAYVDYLCMRNRRNETYYPTGR